MRSNSALSSPDMSLQDMMTALLVFHGYYRESQIQSDLQRAQQGYQASWHVKLNSRALSGVYVKTIVIFLVYERKASIYSGYKSIPLIGSDDCTYTRV